jgi:peptidoglycan/LPS O-acetylase OafA/YrhL
MPKWFAVVFGAFVHPHFAVVVFIVLSGFCLMLPVARSRDKELTGGIAAFAKRRAIRIIPPYYISLAFVVASVFVSHKLFAHSATASADLSLMNILSHVLLFHNLIYKYNMALDSPMWSVAWEWQIYFWFALLLLPIWKRIGIGWTVAAAFLLGSLPLVALPPSSNFNWTSPCFLGDFALGMAGAVVITNSTSKYQTIKNPLLQNAVMLTVLAAIVFCGIFYPAAIDFCFGSIADSLVGLSAMLLLVACSDSSRSVRFKRYIVGTLQSRIPMTLGAFSYSLYLVHYPILQKMRDILVSHHVSHFHQLAIISAIGMPFSMVVAYGFHLRFERPFMPGFPKTERQTEKSAILSPAP